MSTLLADTPTIEAYLRDEFVHDGQKGHGSFTFCYIIGFRAEPARVPTFQVVTEQGAQWARVPLHMLCAKPCAPLPLNEVVWWDCYGYEFAVHQFGFLRGHAVTALCRSGEKRRGVYRLTIDWMGGLGEIADQHKQHHLIALESGQFIAFPNNRLLWHDESWIKGLEGPPDWLPHSESYSVEEGLFGAYKRRVL